MEGQVLQAGSEPLESVLRDKFGKETLTRLVSHLHPLLFRLLVRTCRCKPLFRSDWEKGQA